ncbi:MAG: hypothetical protein FJX80_12735 [Bacteroidetes bacterium]|nr:hypothetical protein [Bacteroidota bacterium]
MKKLRILTLGLLAATNLVSTSCTKAVTDHELNYPHTDLFVQEVTVNAANWSGDEYGYENTITSSAITTELLTEGVVMCYLKTPNGDYMAMPLTLSNGNWVSHWLFSHSQNGITVGTYDDDDATPSPGDRTFKIVIFSQAGLIAHPNVDITDYESVKKEFNL